MTRPSKRPPAIFPAMPNWKRLLLHAYYPATYPLRWCGAARRAAAGRAPIIVLVFHRVAADEANPWTTSPDDFVAAIDWLKKHYELISLSEAQRLVRGEENDRPRVCITFDDGYAVNSQMALPKLVNEGIPCTYFVTSRNVLEGEPFSHDVDMGNHFPPNTLDQLRELADAGIKIGAHTRTHADLGRLADPDALHEEMIVSRDELQDALGQRLGWFAFPFGRPENFNSTAMQIAYDAGFDGVVSAFGGVNSPGGNDFHLRRIGCDGPALRVRDRVTLDPIRQFRTPQVDYPFQRDGVTVGATTKSPARQRPATGVVPIEQRDPLRVMFVSTEMSVGGEEMLLVELIRRMDRTRFAPELCCLKQLDSLGEMLAREVPAYEWLISHKFDVRVLGRLSRLMRRRQIDAVVTVGTGGDKMFWGRLAAWRAGVPVIASAIHSTSYPNRVERANRWLTPLTDAFIAVADTHARDIVREQGCPADKVFVVPNGVDVERFAPQADDTQSRTALRAELGIPPEAPLAGIVAVIRPEKNHRLFVRVAARVRAAVPEAHFLVVGDGPLLADTEAEVRRLGASEYVHFAGARSDVPELLDAMDVFVLTSDMEANPVSILEAMSAGRPVVASRVGSIPETVVDGETGLLAEPGDEAEFARHVSQLMADSSLRDRLAGAARRRVVGRYSVSNMIDGYERLITAIYESKCGTEHASKPQLECLAVDSEPADVADLADIELPA